MTYKVKVFECNIKAQLDDDFALAIKYFKDKANLDVIFDRQKTSVKYADKETQLGLPNDGLCEVVIYLYDRIDQPSNGYSHCMRLTQKTSLAEIPTGIPEDTIGFHWKTTCHELMHSFFQKLKTKGIFLADPQTMDTYLHNDDPYHPDGNFARSFALLKPYWNLIATNMWKHFKPTEPTGMGHTVAELNTHLVDLLDEARDIAGVPFIITSGKRTIAENASVGGVPNSAHLTGEAVDLACSGSLTRWLIVNSLLKVGFNRLEVAKAHIHADISTTLPQNIIDFSSDN